MSSRPRSLRLVAVTVIRNEADILPDFLGHCARLFDEVLAVDHGSVDGSAEILSAARERMPLRLWHYRNEAFAQALLVSALATHAFETGADWVFPLDADEFPEVADRDDLLRRLPADGPGAEWSWRNLWPLRERWEFGRFEAAGAYEAVVTPAVPTYKSAASRRLYAARGRVVFDRGSHWVGPRAPGRLPAIGRLHHIPVRDAGRIAIKVVQRHRSMNQLLPNQPPDAGVQLKRLAPLVMAADGRIIELPDAVRRRDALGYPHRLPEKPAVAVERFDWAPLGRLDGLPAGCPDPAEVLARDKAMTWRPRPDSPIEQWRIAFAGEEVFLEG
jgi:hypothetical protein